jgi:hypothetical protein
MSESGQIRGAQLRVPVGQQSIVRPGCLQLRDPAAQVVDTAKDNRLGGAQCLASDNHLAIANQSMAIPRVYSFILIREIQRQLWRRFMSPLYGHSPVVPTIGRVGQRG